MLNTNESMKKFFVWGIGSLGVIVIASTIAYAAVSQIVGIGAKNGFLWNDVVDSAVGDGISKGMLATGPYVFNGTTFDRLRGSAAGGLTVSQVSSGTGYYAIDRANITTASVNLSFGFTSKKLMLRASANNTDDICVDYLGGTAACPAANTAGNDRLKPGTTMILDNMAVTSVSVIAGSSTQEVQVTAWN